MERDEIARRFGLTRDQLDDALDAPADRDRARQEREQLEAESGLSEDQLRRVAEKKREVDMGITPEMKDHWRRINHQRR